MKYNVFTDPEGAPGVICIEQLGSRSATTATQYINMRHVVSITAGPQDKMTMHLVGSTISLQGIDRENSEKVLSIWIDFIQSP